MSTKTSETKSPETPSGIHAKIEEAAKRNAAAAPMITPEQVEIIMAIFDAPRIAA